MLCTERSKRKERVKSFANKSKIGLVSKMFKRGINLLVDVTKGVESSSLA